MADLTAWFFAELILGFGAQQAEINAVARLKLSVAVNCGQMKFPIVLHQRCNKELYSNGTVRRAGCRDYYQ